jgi:dTDP-4-dehydrorhamnose 3,5-epimerase-like enzyme
MAEDNATIDDVIIRPLSQYADDRGWLIELYREDGLPETVHPVMAYISQTCLLRMIDSCHKYRGPPDG